MLQGRVNIFFRFAEFYELWPTKFSNKTNGVTPRRWIKLCNPNLSELITEKLGQDWIVDLENIEGLKRYADDETFLKALMSVSIFHGRFSLMLARYFKANLYSNFRQRSTEGEVKDLSKS